jgi:DNA/RNA-binding domain of Phe-tRNA-synthetase-like protein
VTAAHEPLSRGWIADDLAEEFPGLALHFTSIQAEPGRSTGAVKRRMKTMSDRFTGGKAVNMRLEPIPWAYRVFFRQVGFDPDEHRTPVEQIALDRMKWGGFRSRNSLDDALLIATVETGVPVIAFDADRTEGEPGLRLSAPDERLGGSGRSLSARQLVIADSARSLAVLFGDLFEDCGVQSRTSRMLLVAPQVKGVPLISVEEAVWTVTDVLRSSG